MIACYFFSPFIVLDCYNSNLIRVVVGKGEQYFLLITIKTTVRKNKAQNVRRPFIYSRWKGREWKRDNFYIFSYNSFTKKFWSRHNNFRNLNFCRGKNLTNKWLYENILTNFDLNIMKTYMTIKHADTREIVKTTPTCM